MSQRMGPKSLAVLNHLSKHGDKNRLELERELGMAQLSDHISKLRRGAHITSLTKERGELVRYQITNSGRNVIGALIQRQESMRYRPLHEMPPYIPKETPVRLGAMDAYRIPSRGM
jgi:hypothetical protein